MMSSTQAIVRISVPAVGRVIRVRRFEKTARGGAKKLDYRISERSPNPGEVRQLPVAHRRSSRMLLHYLADATTRTANHRVHHCRLTKEPSVVERPAEICVTSGQERQRERRVSLDACWRREFG